MERRIEHVLETCLYADDLAAAEEFYCGILGLALHARQPERHLFLRCGSGMLLLFRPEQTRSIPTSVNGAPIPVHGATGAGHVAFAVAEETLPSWRAELETRKIPLESEVHWPAGGISLYVRDPAGNSVELATPNIWRP